MKKYPPALVACLAAVLLVAFGSATVSQARPWHRRSTKKRAPLPEQYEVIDAVNPTVGTLSMHHVGGLARRDRTLTINGFTDVTVGGRKATVADLKPGMRVNYTLGGDGTQLASIASVGMAVPAAAPASSRHR